MSVDKKPAECCKPDCFNCPYPDCKYERVDAEDFKTEVTNDVPREVRMARERANRYAAKNRDKIRKYSLEHYYEHRAEYSERSRLWCRENKQRVAAMKRKRYAENPEYYRQKQREYRARKKVERLEQERKTTVRNHK